MERGSTGVHIQQHPGAEDESDMTTMGVWTLQSGAPEPRLNELNRLIHSLLLSPSVGPNCWNSSFLTMAKCTKTSLFLLLMQIPSAPTGSVIMWSGKHTCTHTHLVKDHQRSYYDTSFTLNSAFAHLRVQQFSNFSRSVSHQHAKKKKKKLYGGEGFSRPNTVFPPVLCRPKQLTKKWDS